MIELLQSTATAEVLRALWLNEALTRLGNRAGATEHALPLSASEAHLLVSGSRKKPIVPVCTHVCLRMYVYVDMHVCVLCMYVMHVCMACMYVCYAYIP